MKIVPVAYKYLKRYPALAITVFILITAESFFEGVSFGMVVPLLQSMTNPKASILEKVPFIQQISASLHSTGQLTAITLIFMAMFAALAAKNIFLYASNVMISKLRFRASVDLSVNLMNNLIEYDLKFFDSAKTGSLVSAITVETRRMGDFILAALNLMSLLVRMFVYIAVLFLLSWKASIFTFALILIVLAPLERIMKKVKKLGAAISQASSDYHFKMMEILGCIKLIKGSCTEESEKQGFKAVANAMAGFQYRSSKYSYSLIPLSEVSIFGLVMVSFLLLAHAAHIDVTSTFPLIATYLLVLVKALTQLNLVNTMRSSAINNLAAFTSYEHLCDPGGKRTIESGRNPVSGFSRGIEFKDTGFSYVDGKPVLRDVSIVIPSGKITAIVGASGVGKSTLVNLIMRYYDASSGSIFVDGVDLKHLDLRAWRKKIGLVSQDIAIFNMSVKDNIAYGHPGVGPEKIIDAAKTANAHDFIMHLPQQYDTVLGERGVRLSGGQKQRISIARAILHNPEILILDEATSSLDAETEKLIKEAIDRLTKDRTVVAVAHRLSTIMHADNIIVLSGGRIVEGGTHNDLIRKNGLYKQLYHTQFSAQAA